MHGRASLMAARYALFAWTCLADKPWLKVLLADLVWEKNTVRWRKK